MTHTPVRAVFAIPGDLDTPTGGYVYDRRVLERLGAHGVEARVLPLPGSYPRPTPQDLEATRAALEGAAPGDVLLVDGLAWGAFPAAMAARVAAPIVALCHHPLGLESGLSAADSQALLASERAALARAAHVVVTSAATRETLVERLGVARGTIAVAEPGVDRAPRARGGGGTVLNLLAVGSLVPRKGYDVLVEALAPLAALAWRLRIVGALDRAPDCVADLRARIARAGLNERIELMGAAGDEDLADLYGSTDLLVSASRYEGYGMVLAEAMTRALPIVATTGGAAADTLPDGAALKVPPDDAAALGAALRIALTEPGARARLSAGAARAAEALPTWDDAAAIVARVLRDVARKERT
ncbi:MAG: Group 1 family glycosyl transferase [Hyphomicrobiales bacterium]|nr:Group 1 family glycosyl transferase [Hyphomicrobiales bacterium]